MTDRIANKKESKASEIFGKCKGIEINLLRDIAHWSCLILDTVLKYQFAIQWNRRNTWWTFTNRLRAG